MQFLIVFVKFGRWWKLTFARDTTSSNPFKSQSMTWQSTTSHQKLIASHPIGRNTSHQMTFHHMRAHHMTSHCTPSHVTVTTQKNHITSNDMPRPNWPHHLTSRHLTTNHITSPPTTWHHILFHSTEHHHHAPTHRRNTTSCHQTERPKAFPFGNFHRFARLYLQYTIFDEYLICQNFMMVSTVNRIIEVGFDNRE